MSNEYRVQCDCGALALAHVVARQRALEMAYNPNDCIKIRWGAPDGSP